MRMRGSAPVWPALMICAGMALAGGALASERLALAPSEPREWAVRGAAPVAIARDGAPATTWEVRARRTRFPRARRMADATPSFAVGGSIASWRPKDAGESDAMITGFARAYLNPTAALQAEVGYWSHTTDLPVVVLAGLPSTSVASGTLRDIPAGVSLLYFVRPQSAGRGRQSGAASLYGGIGVAWHTWRERNNIGDPISLQDTQTAFGYHYIAGLELGRGRGARIFGEYRYIVGRVDNLAGLPLKFDGYSLGGGVAARF